MAGPPTWTVGQELSASDVNTWMVGLKVVKTADESVTSSTTLQNDDVLVLAVASSATYLLTAYINYEGGTQGSSDLKIGWSVPSGTTMTWGHIGVTTAGTITQASVATTSDQTNVPAFGSNGAGNDLAVWLSGAVFVSSTAGNLQMQWAQNTSSGTATKVQKGSWLKLERVN